MQSHHSMEGMRKMPRGRLKKFVRTGTWWPCIGQDSYQQIEDSTPLVKPTGLRHYAVSNYAAMTNTEHTRAPWLPIPITRHRSSWTGYCSRFLHCCAWQRPSPGLWLVLLPITHFHIQFSQEGSDWKNPSHMPSGNGTVNVIFHSAMGMWE